MLNFVLYGVSIIGILILLWAAIANNKSFFYVLLIVKPFIDLTVNQDLFGSFNGLEVSGLLIFLVVLIKYFKVKDSSYTFNHSLMLLFIGVQLLTHVLAIFSGTQSVLNASKFFLKFLNSYFIYFIAASELMSTFKSRLKFIKISWIICFLVGIVTIIVYATGLSNSDVTRGVTRYNGLYNDPGTPSYLSIIAIMFANLYRDYTKLKNFSLLGVLYYLTWLSTIYILYFTMTKSALLMFVVFMLMWYGWHKAKAYLVLPGMVVGIIVSFSLSASLNTRFETEINYFDSGGDSEAARSVGTGRVNRWENIFQYYDSFDFPTKLLGTSRTFNAHNQYIAYLMQCGIIGLTIFIIILGRFMARLTRIYLNTGSPVVFAGLTLLSMYAVYSFTGHPFNYTTLLWYLMLLLGTINVVTVQQKLSYNKEKRKLELRNQISTTSYA